jgi:hypothetical protein
MTAASTPPDRSSVRGTLDRLSTAGATGAITVAGHPGGVIFLVDGQVTLVESGAAPDVGQLLVGRGRVTRAQWDAALRADAPPGEALVDAGRLTRTELELCAWEALHDAAYFVLATEPAQVRFIADATRPPSAGGRIAVAQLCAGVERQRRILDEVHPYADNDTAPVRPVPRPGLDRVLLSGLQWDIVLHADGVRTPFDLAVLLGRPAFAVVLDVRRLVATGLVERHRPASGRARGRSPVVAGDHTGGKLPVLPRRVPGDAIEEQVTGHGTGRADALGSLPGMAQVSTDESVLHRVRAALRNLI